MYRCRDWKTGQKVTSPRPARPRQGARSWTEPSACLAERKPYRNYRDKTDRTFPVAAGRLLAVWCLSVRDATVTQTDCHG